MEKVERQHFRRAALNSGDLRTSRWLSALRGVSNRRGVPIGCFARLVGEPLSTVECGSTWIHPFPPLPDGFMSRRDVANARLASVLEGSPEGRSRP